MVLDTGYVRSHLVTILIGAGAGLAIALLRDPLARLAAAFAIGFAHRYAVDEAT